MADLNGEIAEAIKKNLPLQIGQELQGELAELAKFRERAPRVKAEADSLAAERDSYAKKLEVAQDELSGHRALEKREAAVRERELAQALRDLEVKMAELRRADALGLVHAIFKSPVYRETVASMVPVPVDGCAGGNGNYPTPGTVRHEPASSTITREQD